MVDNSSYRVQPGMFRYFDPGMGVINPNMCQMTSINELDTPSYKPSEFDVMIAILGQTKIYSNDESDQYNKPKKVPYERMMHFFCLNGAPGNNHFIVFLSKTQNPEFFGSLLQFRDGVEFSECFHL